jgi:glycerol-3-phosphate acyltransferase PlsY
VIALLHDAVLVLLCYIVGAIPTGLLIARQFAGIDIREHGSKNIGATNVWRVVGWKAGMATFLLDSFKATAVLLVVERIGAGGIPYLVVLGGVAVLLGNFFNVFLGFKGGKGVATSLGVFLALAPKAILITFVIFAVVLAVSRYVSLASLASAVVLPPLTWYFHGGGPLLYMVIAVSVLVIVKHRANIQRLLAGTENKIGAKKKQPGEQAPAG